LRLGGVSGEEQVCFYTVYISLNYFVFLKYGNANCTAKNPATARAFSLPLAAANAQVLFLKF
jgi:hypothetical protein